MNFQVRWMNIRALLVVGMVSMLGMSSAWAVGVDLVWSPTYSMATGTPTPTAAMGLPGGGLQFDFRLGNSVDFTLGGFYRTRQFNDGADQVSAMAAGDAGLRLKFGKSVFINLGGYYNYYLSGPIATTEGDYGVAAGLGLIIPMGKVGLLINPQYHYALKTLNYGTMVPHEVVALVGLAFGFAGNK